MSSVCAEDGQDGMPWTGQDLSSRGQESSTIFYLRNCCHGLRGRTDLIASFASWRRDPAQRCACQVGTPSFGKSHFDKAK